MPALFVILEKKGGIFSIACFATAQVAIAIKDHSVK